jgi:hypothetical protein
MGFYRIRLLDEDGRLTHSSLFTCHSNEGARAPACSIVLARAPISGTSNARSARLAHSGRPTSDHMRPTRRVS